MCCAFSFAIGLDVDGIYRVSGNLSSINKLRGLIDNGKLDILITILYKGGFTQSGLLFARIEFFADLGIVRCV